MPEKREKERRKQNLDYLRAKAIEELEKSLPMSGKNFKKLFDYLDIELGDKSCYDTNILTMKFLQKIKATM